MRDIDERQLSASNACLLDNYWTVTHSYRWQNVVCSDEARIGDFILQLRA
jgi:hypothetical protein